MSNKFTQFKQEVEPKDFLKICAEKKFNKFVFNSESQPNATNLYLSPIKHHCEYSEVYAIDCYQHGWAVRFDKSLFLYGVWCIATTDTEPNANDQTFVFYCETFKHTPNGNIHSFLVPVVIQAFTN